MNRNLCYFVFAVLYVMTWSQLQANGQEQKPEVTDAEIIRFIVDRNRFHPDHDLDAILKYFPEDGVVTLNRTEGDNAKEIIQTREEVATQTKKAWAQFGSANISELISGTALVRVKREADAVNLVCSFMEIQPVEDRRYIVSKVFMKFTLVKIDEKVKMTRKEILSSDSLWVDRVE